MHQTPGLGAPYTTPLVCTPQPLTLRQRICFKRCPRFAVFHRDLIVGTDPIKATPLTHLLRMLHRAAVETDSRTCSCSHRVIRRSLAAISGHLTLHARGPLYPQKRTGAVQLGMSALGQKQTLQLFNLRFRLSANFCVSDYLHSASLSRLVVYG